MITHGLGSLYIGIASIPIFVFTSWYCRKEFPTLGDLLIGMIAISTGVSSVLMAIEIVPNNTAYNLTIEQTTILCIGCIALIYVTIAETYKIFSKLSKK